MQKNDGGPAFPRLSVTRYTGGDIFSVEGTGMSIRDWFAGEAMKGFIANSEISRNWNSDALERAMETTAEAAYKQADAMLKAREAIDHANG